MLFFLFLFPAYYISFAAKPSFAVNYSALKKIYAEEKTLGA